MSLHSLRRLIVPVVLLVFALFLREPATRLDTVYQELLSWLPYVALGISLLLCVYYNRARLFTLSLIFIAAYYLIQNELQVSLSEPRAFIFYTLISLAIPLSSLLLFFLPERGLFNRYGVMVVFIVSLQLIFSLAIFNIYPKTIIVSKIQSYLAIHPFGNYVLSINGSIFYGVVLLIGILLLYKKDNETVIALLSAVLVGFITFAYFHLNKISVVMFSTVGLIFIISLMRSSFDMAYRDDLTGLLGRRALNERLKGLGKRYVIAMMDVDHFKKFNDTYGHDVGDDVLKVVAKQIAEVKGGGTAYRYGGEEFCIIFPGRDIEYARPYLEEVRKNIESYKMALRDAKHRPNSEETAKERRGRRSRKREEKTVSVTISIGVSSPGESISKADAVLKVADQALYKAKQNGRNCLAIIS